MEDDTMNDKIVYVVIMTHGSSEFIVKFDMKKETWVSYVFQIISSIGSINT